MVFFGYSDAAKLPLTEEAVEYVISEARRAYLTQIGGFLGITMLFGWIGGASTGPAAEIMFVVGGFGLPFFVVSIVTFFNGHLPHAKYVRRDILTALERQTDPAAFWWAYRDLFPMAWK
ncbi:hypothetical protein NHN26_07740 [Rhodovulum tesquicola]|uniref:hypothetical protein n=1 Tax=Rhodovulum tesquicola TaxID=540254 RepID=UPI002096BCFD|nr:hypothetical protein [Rhodovulum tesquicola]MCO8145117.1 hypothetical protein [Rhodovulum tesquicola]